MCFASTLQDTVPRISSWTTGLLRSRSFLPSAIGCSSKKVRGSSTFLNARCVSVRGTTLVPPPLVFNRPPALVLLLVVLLHLALARIEREQGEVWSNAPSRAEVGVVDFVVRVAFGATACSAVGVLCLRPQAPGGARSRPLASSHKLGRPVGLAVRWSRTGSVRGRVLSNPTHHP